jgi:hypothetical protein
VSIRRQWSTNGFDRSIQAIEGLACAADAVNRSRDIIVSVELPALDGAGEFIRRRINWLFNDR